MKTKRKVTLSDVATRAGVSATTASYILNNRSAEMRISAEAEARVRRAAVELAYRPNRSARSLRTSKTKTFGLLSDTVASGQFASQMLIGASAAARESDHLLVIGESEGDPTLEDRLIDEMLDRQVDGLVYATLVACEIALPARLRDRNVVLLNCMDPEAALPVVLPDDLQGGRTAAQLLVDAGLGDRVHVVGLDPNPRASAGPLRFRGIEETLAAAGSTVAGVVPTDWSVVPAFEAMDAWLTSGERPTALICLNDRIAMGTYQALAAHGLSVPHDVSVVSFDGSNLATWLRPSLVSVTIPFAELGASAVRMLMEPPAPAERVRRLPMPLLAGESVRRTSG
ncbi:MAG: LacI family DNA-binding transcriptional regulator [Nocardioidaceae bacterium]